MSGFVRLLSNSYLFIYFLVIYFYLNLCLMFIYVFYNNYMYMIIVTDRSIEFKRTFLRPPKKIIGLVYWNGVAVVYDLIIF